MSYKYIFILSAVLCILLEACSTPNPHKMGSKKAARPDTWEVGCEQSVWNLLAPTKHGKQNWRIVKPCKNLIVRSIHRITPSNEGRPMTVPANQVFSKIASGRVENWVWEFSGTPYIARTLAASSTSGDRTATVSHDLHEGQARWTLLFRHLYDVYRYVLAENPPQSKFFIYFFPSNLTLDKSVTVSAVNSITLPLFFPYQEHHNKASKKLRYFVHRTAFVPCFEYMHALFWTKRLKVPNLLSHSVADWITCTALQLMSARSSGAVLVLPSAQRSRLTLMNKGAQWLRQGEIDHYANIVANENIAHALGFDRNKAEIQASDEAAILRLLRLARAMLQQPVDFTKQNLYPLKRISSVPAFTGTPADTAAKPQ